MSEAAEDPGWELVKIGTGIVTCTCCSGVRKDKDRNIREVYALMFKENTQTNVCLTGKERRLTLGGKAATNFRFCEACWNALTVQNFNRTFARPDMAQRMLLWHPEMLGNLYKLVWQASIKVGQLEGFKKRIAKMDEFIAKAKERFAVLDNKKKLLAVDLRPHQVSQLRRFRVINEGGQKIIMLFQIDPAKNEAKFAAMIVRLNNYVHRKLKKMLDVLVNTFKLKPVTSDAGSNADDDIGDEIEDCVSDDDDGAGAELDAAMAAPSVAAMAGPGLGGASPVPAGLQGADLSNFNNLLMAGVAPPLMPGFGNFSMLGSRRPVGPVPLPMAIGMMPAWNWMGGLPAAAALAMAGAPLAFPGMVPLRPPLNVQQGQQHGQAPALDLQQPGKIAAQPASHQASEPQPSLLSPAKSQPVVDADAFKADDNMAEPAQAGTDAAQPAIYTAEEPIAVEVEAPGAPQPAQINSKATGKGSLSGGAVGEEAAVVHESESRKRNYEGESEPRLKVKRDPRVDGAAAPAAAEAAAAINAATAPSASAPPESPRQRQQADAVSFAPTELQSPAKSEDIGHNNDGQVEQPAVHAGAAAVVLAQAVQGHSQPDSSAFDLFLKLLDCSNLDEAIVGQYMAMFTSYSADQQQMEFHLISKMLEQKRLTTLKEFLNKKVQS